MFTMFSHVGVVVRDLDEALSTWRDVFGLEVVGRMDIEAEGVRSVFLSTGAPYGAGTCVELIAPLDPADLDHPVVRRLAERGEGVYHLAFRARDPDDVADRLESDSIRHVRLDPAGEEPAPRVVVHPWSANGVLVEVLAGPMS